MKLSLITLTALLTLSVAFAGDISHTGDWYISGYYEEPLIAGNNAYIANVYGMAILDITNPANVTLISQQPSSGYTYGLDTLGNYAYLANWQNGLAVVDISNPSVPQLVSQIPLPGEVWTVDVSGDVAAVACGPSGVYFLELTDPAHPSVAGNIGINGFAVDVVIAGDICYVGGWETGVFSINISDPVNPQLVDSYTDNPGIVRGLDYQAGYIYVAEENYGLDVLYSDPQGNMLHVGFVPSTSDYLRLDAFNDRLFVCAGRDGLHIYDLSTPTAPIFLTSLPVPAGEFWGVEFLNDQLWITAAQGGLYAYSYSGTGSPLLLGHYQISGQVLGVARAENIVYAASKGDGLAVFQLSGSSLQYVTGVASPDSARSVTLNNDIAYVCCGVTGIAVYNISSPTAPLFLRPVDTPGFATRLYVDGSTAWVADREGGVSVLNITNPGTPVFVDTVRTSNQALGLAKSGYLLYVADRHAGMTIFNVFNVSIPILLGGLILPDDAMDVALYEQYALVAASSAGLRIVDVSDPTSAVEVAHVDLPGHAERIIIDDHWAYIALHDKGIVVVDLANPLSPEWNAYEETSGSAIDLVLNGDQIILADTYSLGLYAFDPTGVQPGAPTSPQAYHLEACYPNPFNAQARISFTLPKADHVNLSIFDLTGRFVTELISGDLPAGTHQATFNGTSLPSGIYLVHLSTGSYQVTQKLVLLK